MANTQYNKNTNNTKHKTLATTITLTLILAISIGLTSCATTSSTGMVGDSVLNISVFRTADNLSKNQGDDPEAFAQKIPHSKTLQNSLVTYTYGLNKHAINYGVKSFATDGRYFVTLFENGNIITNSNTCEQVDVSGNPRSIRLSGGVLSIYTDKNRVVDFSIYDCQTLAERTVNDGKYTLAGIFSVVISGSDARLYLPGSMQVYSTITMPQSILAIYPSADGKNLYVLDERSNIALYNIEKKKIIDGAQIGYILTGATASFAHITNNNKPAGVLQLVIPKMNFLQYYFIDLEIEGMFSPTLRYSGNIEANMCFFSQGEPTLQCDGLVFTNNTWVPVPGMNDNFAYINNYTYYVSNNVLYATNLKYNYKQEINTNWNIPKACISSGNIYFKDLDAINKKYNIQKDTLTKGTKPRRCTTVSYNKNTATYELNENTAYNFAQDVTPENTEGERGKLFLRKIGRSYYYFYTEEADSGETNTNANADADANTLVATKGNE